MDKRRYLLVLIVFSLLVFGQNVNATTLCTNDWVGGACIGSVTYTSSTSLIASVNASGSVTINSGVTLVTNGFSIILSGNLINSGTIVTGNVTGHQAIGAPGTGTTGFTELNSFAGGGGGGGGGNSGGFNGGSGGSTLVAGGNGGMAGHNVGTAGKNSGTAPTISNASIVSWNNTGFGTLFAGAGGGAGGGSSNSKNGGSGGNGAHGIYLQAEDVVAGKITAIGGAGLAGNPGGGGGGGGAGGFILIAYGKTLTSGIHTVTGGAYGASSGGSYHGGAGGAGQYVTYKYAAAPLGVIKPLSVASASPLLQSVQQGQTAAITDSGANGGMKPYSYQWLATTAGGAILSASTANSLCTDAQSTVCLFSTGVLTATGTYKFALRAYDYGTTINQTDSTNATVVVTAAPTTSSTTIVATTITTSNTTSTIPVTITSSNSTSAQTAIFNCPYDVYLTTPSQFYPSPPIINFSYTVKQTGSCLPNPPFKAWLNIYQYGSNLVYKNVNFNVSQSPSPEMNSTISFNSTGLPPGRYTAQFNFGSTGYSGTGSTNFYVVRPANISVNNFTVTPNATILGSGISLSQTISNNGGLSAANVTLNIIVSGPNNFYDILHQHLGTIRSSTAITSTIQLTGDTDVSGTYSISEGVSFSSNLTINGAIYNSGPLQSNNQVVNYTVIYNASRAKNLAGGLPVPPTNIGNISIVSVPAYSSILIGNRTPLFLGIKNIANKPVKVKISVPNLSYGKLTASVSSILMQGGDSEYIQFIFTSYANATPGIYIDPIRITVNDSGGNQTNSVYIILNLVKKSTVTPLFEMQQNMAVNTSVLTASITVYNPTGQTVNNTAVSVRFPLIAAPVSSISLSGSYINKTANDGETTLEWIIPSIPSNGSVQFSYSVSNITNLQFLLAPSVSTSSTFSPVAPTFSIISPKLLNLTIGEASNITLSALYEGTYQADMTLSLSSNSANVTNPYQILTDVGQEQIINVTFNIMSNTLKNYTLTLSVVGRGINRSYYIPVTVHPPATLVTKTANILYSYLFYIVLAVLLVFVIVGTAQEVIVLLPKKIPIEQNNDSTTNKAMRSYKYDHLFQLISKADSNVKKIKFEGVPTRWGFLTPVNRRDIRIIRVSDHLVVYTRGSSTDIVKKYLASKNIRFVELMVD